MGYTEGASVSFKGNTMPAAIISGPHPTYGADRWLIRKADGKVTLARESELSPVLTQREKVAAIAYVAMVPDGMWGQASLSTRRKYLRIADAVIAELGAEAKPRPLAVGDRIRILKGGLSFAEVKVGDVLPVIGVSGESLHAKTSKLRRGYYVFQLEDEGTGWERVA